MTRPVICHVGAFGPHNLGDLAIQEALHQAIGPGFDWLTVNCQERVFDEAAIDEINENANLLLIGGGGLLWDKPGLDSPSGWQFQITPELIERITVPIIVHAIGWTAFPYGDDTTGLHPNFELTVADLFEKAVSVTVRNQYTADMVGGCRTGIGFLDCPPRICPDPALFLPRVVPTPKEWKRALTVGVCMAEDHPLWRWPTQSVQEQFRARLTDTIDDWHDGSNTVMVAHTAHEDGYTPFSVEDLCRVYERCDVVLSMRKHGLLVAASQGVPVVGIGDMAEVRSICEQLRAPWVGSDGLHDIGSACRQAVYSRGALRGSMVGAGFNRWCELQDAHEAAMETIRRAAKGRLA